MNDSKHSIQHFSKPESAEISIIIQGAVADCTAEVIAKLRLILPQAEIILSTWEGQAVLSCHADQIVLSKDPGNFVQNHKIKGAGHFNNANRQIVSSIAGLKAASRKYALKTRTDIFIEKNEWLNIFGKYDEHTPPSIFNKRLLICNYYSRNPRIFPLPFHWGDWVFFGETCDLIDVFDIPLMDGDDRVWFEINERSNLLFSDNINRYLPEQWILSSFLRKHMNLNFDTFYDASKINVIITERFFTENTVILDIEQWGINFVKYNPNRYKDKSTILHFKDWLVLYKRYVLHKKGISWLMYLGRGILWRVIHYCFRPLFVIVLSKLGIKEKVRLFLNRDKAQVDKN